MDKAREIPDFINKDNNADRTKNAGRNKIDNFAFLNCGINTYWER